MKTRVHSVATIGAISSVLFLLPPFPAQARSCLISPAAARARAQQVQVLLDRGANQLRQERTKIRQLERRTEEMAQAVAVGRMAFATSMAAGTVLTAGVTASWGGMALSSSVDFAGFIGRVFAGAGTLVGAPLTAGMAYGTYRSILGVGNSQVSAGREDRSLGDDREADARTYLDFIREPESAPNPALREVFSHPDYEPVRSFLAAELCPSPQGCNPVPADFSKQRALIERAHRTSVARFEHENSDWWPEVISNHEARRLATVELPYHEGIAEQLEQGQAFFRLVHDSLRQCEE